MEGFKIDVKKKRLRGKISIVLEMKKSEMGNPRFKELAQVLESLRKLYLLGNSGALERLEAKLEKIIEKEYSLSSIRDTINGPFHGNLSGNEMKRLMKGHEKLLKELTPG